MTKKTTAAVSVSTTSTLVAHGVTLVAHGLTSSADATSATHISTSSVEGRRCCTQCSEWLSLESFEEHARICRACWAEVPE